MRGGAMLDRNTMMRAFLMIVVLLTLARAAHGQAQPRESGDGTAPTQIDAGVLLAVRTEERIETDRSDGRIFYGIIDQDAIGGDSRVIVSHGSIVELLVRPASDS